MARITILSRIRSTAAIFSSSLFSDSNESSLNRTNCSRSSAINWSLRVTNSRRTTQMLLYAVHLFPEERIFQCKQVSGIEEVAIGEGPVFEEQVRAAIQQHSFMHDLMAEPGARV